MKMMDWWKSCKNCDGKCVFELKSLVFSLMVLPGPYLRLHLRRSVVHAAASVSVTSPWFWVLIVLLFLFYQWNRSRLDMCYIRSGHLGSGSPPPLSSFPHFLTFLVFLWDLRCRIIHETSPQPASDCNMSPGSADGQINIGSIHLLPSLKHTHMNMYVDKHTPVQDIWSSCWLHLSLRLVWMKTHEVDLRTCGYEDHMQDTNQVLV